MKTGRYTGVVKLQLVRKILRTCISGGVLCVVTLLFGFFCRCKDFCLRAESDLFLFSLYCHCQLDFHRLGSLCDQANSFFIYSFFGRVSLCCFGLRCLSFRDVCYTTASITCSLLFFYFYTNNIITIKQKQKNPIMACFIVTKYNMYKNKYSH